MGDHVFWEADSLMKMRLYPEAKDKLITCQKLYKEEGNIAGWVQASNWLTEAYIHLRGHDKANQLLEESYEVARTQLPRNHVGFGHALLLKGKRKIFAKGSQAKRALRTAIAILDTSDNSQLGMYSRYYLAVNHEYSQDYDSMQTEIYDLATRIRNTKMPSKPIEIQFYVEVLRRAAISSRHYGRYVASISFLDEAISFLNSKLREYPSLVSSLISLHESLGKIYALLGDYEQAIRYNEYSFQLSKKYKLPFSKVVSTKIEMARLYMESRMDIRAQRTFDEIDS